MNLLSFDTCTDVMSIAGKLRPGYKAPLSVWRSHANLELTLVIPAGVSAPAVISDAVAAAPTVPANRAPAASQTQQSATPAGAMYCHALLATQHTYGATVSPVKLIAGAANDMQHSLNGYIAHVKQNHNPSIAWSCQFRGYLYRFIGIEESLFIIL